MSRKVTWVHLSDLHMCPKLGENFGPAILDKLLVRLQKDLAEARLRPDFLFFTGDLAFGQIANKPELRVSDQLLAGHNFLDKVARILPDFPGFKRVFIV